MNAKRDQNSVPTLLGTLNTSGTSLVLVKVNTANHGLKISNGTTATSLSSYSETNQNGTLQSGGGDPSLNPRIGETFTPSISSTLISCKFYIGKIGSPTGTATAKLYAMTGTLGVNGLPTGTALATSGTVNVSTLVLNSFALVTFNFTGANRVPLVFGTNYCIELDYSGGDGVDYVNVGIGSSNLPTGNLYYFDTFSNPTTDNIDALVFYVYGSITSSSNALRDENSVTGLTAVSSSDGVTPVNVFSDSSGNLLIN